MTVPLSKSSDKAAHYDAPRCPPYPIAGKRLHANYLSLLVNRIDLKTLSEQNSQTANAALKRIGYGGKLVANGLRSIGNTGLNEAGVNINVIEAALAHVDKNQARPAYNRSLYLENEMN